MKIEIIKKRIILELESRNLKEPRIRLSALEKICYFLKSENLNTSEAISKIAKIDLLDILSKYKKLNAAEKSIVNDIYRIV